jgi:small subunit ribosomal protein S6
MLKRYQDLVTKNGGNIHRVEDIGRLQLAYTIKDMHKAHYVLMNLECDGKTLSEIESSFEFNDSIMRHLVVRMTKAETSPSKLFLLHNKDAEQKRNKDAEQKRNKDAEQKRNKDAEQKRNKDAEQKQIDPEIGDKDKTADQPDKMKLVEATDQDTSKDLGVKSETDLNESDTQISATKKEEDSDEKV